MFDLMPFEKRHDNFLNYMDALDKSFFGSAFPSSFDAFKTDIREEADKFVLEAELPGFQKEDLQISLNGDRLTIRAERSGENEEKTGSYLRRERSYGSYQRSFDVSGIDAAHIEAAYKDGVLELQLPKLAEQQPAEQRIEIK